MNFAALYVYSIIVGWIFVTGVGILPFIPEEFAVASLGVWMHKNPDAYLVIGWAVCVLAVLGTDLFLYAVGRLGGPRLMNRPFVQKFLKPERVQLFATKFQQRGIWFMLTARLIPGWRSAVFITAGVIQYPVGKFCLADAISAVPLVTFFFFGGYFAADTINEIIANIHRAQNILLLIAFVGLLVVAVVLYLRWMRAREKEEEVEEAIEHVKMEEAQANNTETSPVPGLIVSPPSTASGTETKQEAQALKTEAEANQSLAASGAEASVGPQS